MANDTKVTTSDIVDEQVAGISRRKVLLTAAQAAIVAPMLLSTRRVFAQGDQPVAGGTLVEAVGADPGGSIPSTTTSVPDQILGGLIYEGLTRIEQDFSVVPNLAESWTVSPDGLKYTFSLVSAQWQDGKPFTSEDVKYTLQEVASKISAKFKAAGELLKAVETPDAQTVVIELTKPYGPLLFSLSSYGGGAILPAHVFKGTNPIENPAGRDRPVGTGPFMLKEWIRGDRIVLVKNPNYWRQGKPYLDSIVLRIIPDINTRILALQSGEVDYIDTSYFAASRFDEVSKNPALQTRLQAVPANIILAWNLTQAPFNNKLVRQALFRATDREFIKKVVFHDLGKVMTNYIDSRLAWAHNSDVDLGKMYPLDLEKAGAMLDEAGFPADSSGKRFEVRLAYSATEGDYVRAVQVLTSQWQKLGVRVIAEGKPFNVFVDQVFIKRDFDGVLMPYTTAGDPALGVSRAYTTESIQPRPFVNVSHYSNPEVDRLFAAGAFSPTLEDRGAQYKAIAPILAEDLPIFPILESQGVNVSSKKVRGKWAWGALYDYWEDVWIVDKA